MSRFSTEGLLPEDAAERRMFDMHVATLGTPLAVIANYLSVLALTLPQQGSMAQQCAVMYNEVRKHIDTHQGAQ